MSISPPDALGRTTVLPLTRSARALLILSLVLGATSLASGAGTIAPDIQKHARLGTFEVVVKKPQKDALSYEKPLPLELIPFAERNDAYWPIGSAFAVAPGTFVTAGHVIFATIGGQFGVPSLRDSEGRVFPIERVLKYAAHEDFVVFTVSGEPNAPPFDANTSPALDTAVFAVGNALGEGVVVRDGLLTSFTPEAQDGKWKWLRFSAAASPGNSGGPLLDGEGRVLGVVAAKSPNENLNYALPIDTVLKFTDKAAMIDTRASFGIPHLLQATVVSEFKDSFPLPLPYAKFSDALRETMVKSVRSNLNKLAEAESPHLLPHGGAKILATLYASFDPSLLSEADDRSWDAHSCGTEEETPLPDDGRVWHCKDEAVATLFRLRFSGTSADERRYRDSKEFMDLFLKGVKLTRMVGQQAVRVTSFGAALQDSLVHDHFGRVWQFRAWSLGFADAYVATLALPTPDGYVGLQSIVPSFLLDSIKETMTFAADYLYLSYSGSLPQWRAYLDRHDLRPTVFEHCKLQYEPDKYARLTTPRLELDSAGLTTLGPRSSLGLQMAYMLDHGKIVWDVGGVVLHEDRDKATFVAAYRQAMPADDASHELRERWEHMQKRDGDFAGTPTHDNDFKNFWVRTVAGNAGAGAAQPARPLYEVVYTTDNSILPRQFEEIRSKLAQSVKITE